MTIGDSFHATTTAIRGSLTARADGSPAFDRTLTVDLRALDTGIELRNQHLRDNYLEVGNGPGYATATLSEIRINPLQPEAPESTRSYTGLLTLHGVTQAVSGTAAVRQTSTGARVKASCPVALADYQIRKPRYRASVSRTSSRLKWHSPRLAEDVMSRTLLLVVVWLVSASAAWAEPTFLAKQYTRCGACHNSPTGGGLVTPYGWLLSHRELSTTGNTRPVPDGGSEDSPLGEQSFFYGVLGNALGPVHLGSRCVHLTCEWVFPAAIRT
jgi:polyisoprenoid-binding protein YceI